MIPPGVELRLRLADARVFELRLVTAQNLAHHFARYPQLAADRLDRLALNAGKSPYLQNCLHKKGALLEADHPANRILIPCLITPHVAMSILLWTGCRIEDTTILGRKNECMIVEIVDGERLEFEAVRWQPSKKGSAEVAVPLLPPLKEATRAPKVQGATYLLGRGGKPYSSGDSASWRSTGIPKQKPVRFTRVA